MNSKGWAGYRLHSAADGLLHPTTSENTPEAKRGRPVLMAADRARLCLGCPLEVCALDIGKRCARKKEFIKLKILRMEAENHGEIDDQS